MRTTLIIVIILSFLGPLFGQQKQTTEPFIIKGQILFDDISEFKLTNGQVRIDFTDEFDHVHSDSTFMDENGIFYLETNAIVKPVRINLVFDFDSYPDILAAPGYDLFFFKPTKNRHDFKLTGKGSNASKYYRILDSIPSSKYYSLPWWNLDETNYLKQINRIQSIRDSVASLIFGKGSVQDKNIAYFEKMVRLDNKFEKLKYLFLYANHKRYSYEKTILFVRNNFDADFFKDMSNDEYLISQEFRSGVSSHWPDSFLNYLLLLDDPLAASKNIDNLPENFKLEKANVLFSGEVRSFILYKIMTFPIWTFKSIEDLNSYRNQLKPYFSSFSESSMTALDNAFSEKMKRLIVKEEEITTKQTERASSFVGKPAPAFTLKNKNDRIYKLDDFKGKVVVLDLWSSWCNLCRIENKSFKALRHKYRKNKNIEFIAISVFDTNDEWTKALKEDKPGGIQLFDANKTVFEAYVDEHIPKFILIDKKGNIVNFMAPKPSDDHELEKQIDRELEKKPDATPMP
ncbi:MAG: redoxin domain-containing protein [Bacteroidota bacterium]|nr:redoxin domain-containing protein [Bacteroidota bacterium]